MAKRSMPAIGTLCLSKAGHDAGRYYIVTAYDDADPNYVYIADGRSRRLKKPKRKKRRHLHMTPIVLDEAARKLESGRELSDGELYNMIKRTGRVMEKEVEELV